MPLPLHDVTTLTEAFRRAGESTLPARAGGEAAVGLSLIPQPHGGALLSGGKPANPGHNRHTGIDRTAVSTGVGAFSTATACYSIPPSFVTSNTFASTNSLNRSASNIPSFTSLDKIFKALSVGTARL